MAIIAFLIWIFITAGAIWLAIKSHKIGKAALEYEFENRTEGGTVQFNSFEDSLRHDRKKRFAYYLQIVSGVLLIISVLIGSIIVAMLVS